MQIRLRVCTENHFGLKLLRQMPEGIGSGREYKRLSIEGRRVDALALGADERRDKLRKAAGSCT